MDKSLPQASEVEELTDTEVLEASGALTVGDILRGMPMPSPGLPGGGFPSHGPGVLNGLNL